MKTRDRGRRLPVIIGALIALLVAPWPAGPALGAQPRVTDVTLTEGPAELQVVVAASGPVHYRLVDVNPSWIVVDVEGALLAMPGGTLPLGNGVVRKVRVGQFAPGTVRVVIELSQPVKFHLSTPPDGSAVIVGIPSEAAKPAAQPVAQYQVSAQLPPPPPSPGPSQTPNLINLDLRDVDITDVLSALAKLAGVNIVTDTEVKGKITVRLTGVTFQEALQLILEPNGLAYTMVGNNIIVAKREKLITPFIRQYQLTNIRATDFVTNILPVTGVKKEQVSIDEPDNVIFISATADDQARVQALLRQVDSPSGRLVTRVIKLSYIDASTFLDLLGARLPAGLLQTAAKVDKASNSVVLTLNLAQMQGVEALQAQVDNPLPQVLIEASVVEVPTEVIRNLGLTWPSPYTLTVTSTGTDPGTGKLSFTVMGSPIAVVLNTLIQENKSKLLANPRLAVRDGETARMNIGDKIPFQVINPQGVPSVVIIEAGVKLEITPRVNGDGYITLRMHPEVSAITTPPAPNVPPTISTREADSSLTIKDGSSIVLAGLIQQKEVKTTVKVPILGDIPVLGWFFKNTSTDKTDNEIIFIITPHILQKTGS